MEEQEVSGIVEDYLKDLILNNFDPKKADTIFREGSVSDTIIIFHENSQTFLIARSSRMVTCNDKTFTMENNDLSIS